MTKRRFRSDSPVPPVAAEGSNTLTRSAGSDTLASIIKVLDAAEKAVDGLPIYGPKAVISTIRTVLQSVKQSSDIQRLKQLEEQVRVLEASVFRPLSGRTEVPPALESALNSLKDKVKEATTKWERKPGKAKRGRFKRSPLPDQEASKLQGFVNDIKEALQMFKSSVDVHQILQQFEKSVFEELNKIPRARGAGYDSRRSNAPSRCLEGTRTAILKKIRDWLDRPISDTTVEPIYWVNGLAGIGKSTIACTVAEDACRPGPLGASFFFSRQENELSDPALFVSTIAYQIAQSYPEARSAIVHLYQRDPDVVRKSYATQVQDLILEPLRKIAHRKPVLLVVDALDECSNSDDAASNLFRAVVARCAEVSFLRVLMTSRPETYIKAILTGSATTGIVLHEDIEQSVVSEDIRRYLRVEMLKIPTELGVRLSSPWPSEADLDVLVGKSGKLFIWAATAIRFVGDRQEGDPDFRLEVLLDKYVSPGMDIEQPYAQLDNLYLAILSRAATGLRKELIERMRILVGTIARLRSEMPLEVIGQFLEIRPVATTLGRIQSIIPIPTDTSQPVQIYHPSFPDFITSRERCRDSRFYVDTPSHERRLALRCLDILNDQLSEDLDELLEPTKKVSALSKEVVLRAIPLEVQYACRFWAVHVTYKAKGGSENALRTRLEKFSSTMLLRWVVAMSILGAIPDAIAATRTMQQWMDDAGPCNHLKEAFYDTERMMLGWSGVISRYPTQLYYSVLPFLPSDTYLSCHYPTHTSGISILRGRDRSWSPLLFTLTRYPHDYEGCKIAFARKGQMVALASFSRIDLFDALSGLLLSSIWAPEPPDSDSHCVGGVAFSADASEVIVVRWSDHDMYCDVVKYNVTRQIGRVHRIAPVQQDDEDHIQLSEGGSYVAFPEFTESEHQICIWRTDSGDDTFISIRHTGEIRDIRLSADSAHLVAVATDNTIIIADVLSGNILQTLGDTNARNICISPDGSFIASASDHGDTIRLWSTTQGTLLATLENPSHVLAFSRTNRLYMAVRTGGGSVCDVLAEHDRSVIVPFPFPPDVERIMLSPDDTQIAISLFLYTQVWSLKHFKDTHDDSGLQSVLSVDLSSDASHLAISTQTKIEVWDARIGECRHILQSESAAPDDRCIAFSPRGELIVSSSRDGIIVIDLQTGTTRPTTYSVMKGQAVVEIGTVGISFDSSLLAASTRVEGSPIWIWDLPSGALLYTISGLDISPDNFRWSWNDLYLEYFDNNEEPMFLNTKTFRKEVLSDLGDRFHEFDHFDLDENRVRIRSSHQRKEPLFLALPLHLNFSTFRCHGDRVSILSEEGRLLLLDISGLNTYMKEFCFLESMPEDNDSDGSDDADDGYNSDDADDSDDSDW